MSSGTGISGLMVTLWSWSTKLLYAEPR